MSLRLNERTSWHKTFGNEVYIELLKIRGRPKRRGTVELQPPSKNRNFEKHTFCRHDAAKSFMLILPFGRNQPLKLSNWFITILCVLCYCLVYIVVTSCVLLSHILQLLDCWLAVSIQKVLRPATSAQVLLGFPVSVYKRMLRWFPTLPVATACFSCSLSDLNFLVPYFIFMYMHNNHCHRATAQLQLILLLSLLLLLLLY